MTTLILAATLLAASQGGRIQDDSTTIRSRDSATVFVNDDRLRERGIINRQGRVLVPMRAVSESLGANVDYRAATKRVIISRGNRKVTLDLDENRRRPNRAGQSATGARLIAGTVYVPLRVVGESLGAEVEWNPTRRAAYVTGANRARRNDPPTGE